MKRCKNITCWTDYPFFDLGDEGGKCAPVRHVRVLGYDGNKYARVQVIDASLEVGAVEFLKTGYLYSQPLPYHRKPRIINRRKLERMVPTRKYYDK